MEPVELRLVPGDQNEPQPRNVKFGGPGYRTLPGLMYDDGTVLTEWKLTEEERQRILNGENLRLWIFTGDPDYAKAGQGKFLPITLEVTSPDVV